jgi:hypothetical protein
MKRFIVSILSISVFFIGPGTLVDKVGARFKSDEKALELIAKARAAVGGDAAIAGVQSMLIVGRTAKTFRVDGIDRTELGETEIAFQMPNKFMKSVKLGHDGPETAGEKIVKRDVQVVVSGDREKVMSGDGEAGAADGVHKVIIRKGDGTAADGEKRVIIKKADGDNILWKTEGDAGKTDGQRVFVRKAGGEPHGGAHQNELLRTTLALLLTAPQGMDVSYTFSGEGNVGGTPCNIVEAAFGGSTMKLYLGKDSNLPMMLSFFGSELPRIMKFRADTPPQPGDKDTLVFTRTADGPAQDAEIQVTFSDYRSVGGLQVPFRWSQTVNGAADETFDVTNVEINPANIDEVFKNRKIMVRTPAEVQN